jgi:hypothetical protein
MEQDEKIKCLVPFFEEFGMQKYLDLSIEVMLDFVIDFHGDVGVDDEHKMCHLEHMLEQNLAQMFQDSRYVGAIGKLDQATMRGFLSFCLPIRRADAEEHFSSASCPDFWSGLNTIVGNHFEGLARDGYDSSDVDLLASIVHLSFHVRHLEL